MENARTAVGPQGRLDDSHRYIQASVDALSTHICVLDSTGQILAVNRSWRNFAEGNYSNPKRVCEGSNYLTVCEQVRGAEADQARLVATKIRAILRHEIQEFSWEYPCHSPTEQRWFLLKMTPFLDSTGPFVIVAHENITERKQAELTLMERNQLLALDAEVGRIINTSQQLIPLLQGCTEALVRHLQAAFARIWTLNAPEQILELQASAGLYTHLTGPHSRVPVGHLKIGQIAAEKKPHLTNAVIGDPRVPEQEWAKREGLVAFAGYPLLRNQDVVGVMALFSKHPLTEFTLNSLGMVADRITLAVERQMATNSIQRLAKHNERILASAGEGIYGLDLEGKTTFVNPAGAQMLGYRVEELIGVPMHSTMHHTRPDGTSYPQKTCPIYAAFRDGSVHHVDDEVLWRKDGTSFPVGYTSTPIWEDGRLVGAVVTFQDITERKRAEVMQHKQQREYQTIFNSVPAMIWYVDKDNTVLRANQLAVHTTGLGLEEIQGQSAYDLYPDEAAQYHKDTLDVISSGKPKEGIIEPYQLASGEKRWVRTDKIPYRDDQGNIVGVIVFAVDITAEKQAQLLVQEERKVLEMIATGHSLPTILGTITAQMETLLPHSLCSILLLDETGTRLVHGVAPSLPEEYIQAINGIEVGPGVGSCGTAAYLGETVIVADIEEDPLWANFRQLAKVHGLRTCWSFPIKSSQGAVLGTYALYYTNPKHPTQHELALVDSAAHLAAIGIERRRGEEAISRLNQELEQRVVERTHQLEIKVRESREAQARSQSLAKFPAENPNPVLRLSREGRILYANKASKPLLAIWRCEEGQTLPEPWHQLTLEGFRTNLLQQGEVQAPNRVYSLTFAPIEHANYMNIYGLDITARKQAEEAMLKGERKFRAIYEQAPTGIAIVDSLSGQFTQINQKYCDITGYSAEEMLERTFQELTHPDDLQADLAQMQQLLADQISSFQIEKRYIRKDGELIWVNLTCVPLWLEPTDPRQHMAMVEDITQRKQGEAALKASEERLGMALDATSEGVWDWDLTSDRVFFSPRWLESLGFAPDELEPHVDSWKSLVHPDDVPRMMETLKAHLEGRTPVYECENRLLTKSGRWRWNLDRGKVVARDQNGRALRMVGVDVDISKRRQAEEALRDKSNQLEVITEAMTAYLERGNWCEASSRLIQGALGQTESEYGFVGVVLDGPVLRILAYEGVVWNAKINQPLYEEAVRNFEAKGYLEFTEMNNLFGHVITSGAVVLSNSPASDPRAGGRLLKGHPPLKSFLGVPILRENEVVGMIGVANRQNGYTGIEQDKIQILTRAASVLYENYSQRQREATLEMARQQAEEQIRTALNEKEVLLKEIHHRVKNNLQVVSSLLSLQASKLVDDQQREPFQVSQDRLQAMLLIHEQLYRSENLREISFGEFIERQAHELWRAYGVDSERVILDIRADGVRMDIEKAIPCGLIVTELLTNALKYAFPSEKAGKIIIQLLAAQDARVALTISDNGVGLPDSFDIRHVNSLGMRLVCALTDQLEGSIKLTREGGTEFMIQFPQ